MAFRDDREALRSRADALEGELDETREQLERASEALARQEEKDEEDETELRSLRDEVNDLRKKLGVEASKREKGAKRQKERKQREKQRNTQRSQKAPRVRWLTWFREDARMKLLAVALAIFGGGLGYFVIKGQVEKPEKVSGASVVTPASVPPALVPAPPALPTLPPPAPAGVISFGAEVMSVEGLTLERGDGCVIEAELSSGPSVGRVRVICDGLLYESTMDGGTEVTMHDERVRESVDAAGQAYELSYGDTGTRTGPRPQLRVDTREARADVWRDGRDPFRLELRVDDLSVARTGPRLQGAATAPATGHGFRLRALVTGRRGPASNISADECSVVARPYASQGRLNCRLLVSCGADLVYGAENTGYNLCTLADQMFEDVNDEGTTASNSDPILRLDRSAGTMVLADDGASGRWEVEFRLEPDPRCKLSGHWTGALNGDDSMPQQLDLSAGEQVVLTRELADSAAEVAAAADDSDHVMVDCVRGTATLVGEDGARWEGRFGPGFATLVGRVRGGDARTFWLRRE